MLPWASARVECSMTWEVVARISTVCLGRTLRDGTE